MKPRSSWVFAFAFVSSTQPLLAVDWWNWRGPEQTGAVREKAVVTTWSPEGDNLLWRVPIGGRSTPVVHDNRVFLITPVGEGIALRERVIALDQNTGETVWEYRFNVFDTDIVENRVGWTSLVVDPDTGNVYAHGTGGELYCFSRDGKVLWKDSIRENYGRVSGFGGRLVNPIIDERRVIATFLGSGWGESAKPAHRFVAFDKRTGKVLWSVGPGGPPMDTIYSTPIVAVIDGVRQLVAGSADGFVHGMKARTGELLWSYRVSKLALNATVVTDGKYIYASHSEENPTGTVMGAVVCIDPTKRGDISETGTVWRVEGIEAGYASPAIAKGRLYVVDNSANLYCLDAATGKTNWRYTLGRVGKASPVVTDDGVIYIGEVNGVFHILKDDGDKCTSLDEETFTRPDNAVVEIYGSAAVVNGRVYFTTRYETMALGKKEGNAEIGSSMPAVKEKRTDKSPPSLLHVFPSEITLSPGEKLQLEAIYYDADGQVTTGEAPAWSVTGATNALDAAGVFTAPVSGGFLVATVVAKSPGGLEGKARIRVTPKMPFSVDFESMKEGETPAGWVGVSRKTKIVERDGSKTLQKLAEDASAPFMRVKAYMTPPIEGGYTVVADMLGTPKGERFRPDLGLLNSRYEMSIMGMGKVLRLESWTPIPRFRHDVPFEFEPNKWYRMKFQVVIEPAGAKLRGKVWPRDSAEPSTWNTEFFDSVPNREGSPGLYAYSPGTTPKSKGPEVFFDNVQVMPNE